MCGIVGYRGGSRPIGDVLLRGLKRVKYRGYDSAGVAVLEPEGLRIVKAVGKVERLDEALQGVVWRGTVGIGHTRWATHGEVTQANAHPHTDCHGQIGLVHNGIIENYRTLKQQLERHGHTFSTQTDTEVLPHLVEECYRGNLTAAVREALTFVEGTYGLAVVHVNEPGCIVGARNGSPLLVGRGVGEYFLASDVASILDYTHDVFYLEDREIVTLTDLGPEFSTVDNGGVAIPKDVAYVDWDLETAEKGGFADFMLKEIFEQGARMRDAMAGRTIPILGQAQLSGLGLSQWEIRRLRRLLFLACGTSFYASLFGKYFIEHVAELPVDVESASEFRYRKPVVTRGTAAFAVTQSGETIDTLAALQEVMKRLERFRDNPDQPLNTFGIVNVVGSTIARKAGRGIYIHAGPEIGVASTKAFTCQCVILALLGLLFARHRGKLDQAGGQQIIAALKALPDLVEQILAEADQIKAIADASMGMLEKRPQVIYLGRGGNYPAALEGALKLTEIAYLMSVGYAGAEMKHGPIALIDEHQLVIAIATQGQPYQKMAGNIAEVKSRQGKVIAIATRGDREIAEKVDHVIWIPETLELLTPILSVVPLQLFAYYVAVNLQCDVDNPRNLAKSVTVE